MTWALELKHVEARFWVADLIDLVNDALPLAAEEEVGLKDRSDEIHLFGESRLLRFLAFACRPILSHLQLIEAVLAVKEHLRVLEVVYYEQCVLLSVHFKWKLKGRFVGDCHIPDAFVVDEPPLDNYKVSLGAVLKVLHVEHSLGGIVVNV